MLVHSFSQTMERLEDYAQFAALFGVDAKADRVHFAGRVVGVDLYLAWVKGDKRFLEMGPDQAVRPGSGPGSESIEGVVTARECQCCGHHEIGITTQDGKYMGLKPGMKIGLTQGGS